MKLNAETVLLGRTCLLVPYRRLHVPTYHEWMKDPFLLSATGSEPLTLAEEYEMQQQWLNDDKKLTFIVLDRDKVPAKLLPPPQLSREEGFVAVAIAADAVPDIPSTSTSTITSSSPSATLNNTNPLTLDAAFLEQTLPAMVGDVNVFLSEEEQDEDTNDDCLEPQDLVDANDHDRPRQYPGHAHPRIQSNHLLVKNYYQAELDIMIAVPDSRRKGIGWEACWMMMLYVAQQQRDEHLPPMRRFFSKINHDNVSSLALFRDKLGFRQCAYAECFQQYELELGSETPTDLFDRIKSIAGRREYRY